MYKVMLVDEDNFITQKLLNSIDWSMLNLTLIHIVNNKKDAIEKFTNEPVDIVITDMNKFENNELNFVNEINNISDDVHFIILSQDNESCLIKKLHNLKTFNQIFKPINQEKFYLLLLDVVMNLNVKDNTEEKKAFENQMLYEFILNKITYDDLSEIKKFKRLSNTSNRYTVSIITLIGKKNLNIYSKLSLIIKKVFKRTAHIIFNEKGQIIVFNNWCENISNKEIEYYFEEIKNCVINNIKLNTYILIGDLVDNIINIHESYKSACYLEKYILINCPNICLTTHSKQCKNKKIDFSKELDKINKFIFEKKTDKLLIYIKYIYSDSTLSPDNLHNLSLKILFLIDKIMEEFKLDKENNTFNLLTSVVKLYSCITLEDVKTLLNKKLTQVIDFIDNNTIKYSPVIQQIVTYVNEKYTEDISLKTLSQKYNVNSSYLGQIFNREVGIPFSEYLNKIKNTKAKELILNTNIKINDIAKIVGYSDSSYFYRKFKKHFGVSPSTIRNMKKY